MVINRSLQSDLLITCYVRPVQDGSHRESLVELEDSCYYEVGNIALHEMDGVTEFIVSGMGTSRFYRYERGRVTFASDQSYQENDSRSIQSALILYKHAREDYKNHPEGFTEEELFTEEKPT